MSFLRMPVDKPVATVMLFIGIALLGVISWSKLPQELFPSLEFPQISIVTKYEGAGPEESEKLISKLIEESVGTVKHVAKVSSVSKEGVSVVTVEFKWGTNMDFASMEVREKIDLIKQSLPKDANEPIVLKYNPFQMEAMILSVSYKEKEPSLWKLADLRQFCKKNLKDELERLDGVAKVEIRGGEKKEILVEIDKGRLLANQISLMDTINSIKDANVTYPAGTIKEDLYEYLVKTVGEFQTINDIASLSFSKEDQSQDSSRRSSRRLRKDDNAALKKRKIVFIRDIANVREELRDKTGYSRYNLTENISMGIYPQSGSNLIKLSEGVEKKLLEIQHKFPKDIEVKVIYDQSEFVRNALSNIYQSAIQGGLLSFVLLYIFMKSMVASVIINIAIPICVLITVSLMYFQGISINTMSLGGITIGFGMVVDSANIVMENVLVNYKNNPTKPQKELIYDSTRELLGPIIASTLTTVAIFLPFIFVTGMAGQMFKQLALTITYSMIGSVFVALLLVPRMMLNLDLSKYSTEVGRETIAKYFTPALVKVMNWPIKTLFFWTFVYAAIGATMFMMVPKEFMPKIDERRFVVDVTMHPETPLEVTNDTTMRMEQYLSKFKEVKDLAATVGSTGEDSGAAAIESMGPYQARIVVRLTKDGRSTKEVVSMLNDEIKKWGKKNLETDFITQQGLFGSGVGSSAGLTVEVKGRDLKELRLASEKIKAVLNDMPDVYGIKINPSALVRELKVQVDRERASLFGLSTQDISAMSLAAIKGFVASKLKLKEDEYDIRVRMRPEDRSNIYKVGEMTAFSQWGMTIQLKQISDIGFVESLPSIRRTEGQRTYLVTANIKKNFNKAVKNLANRLKTLDIGQDNVAKITGELVAFKESMSSSVFALSLGIIIIYMILASQFENLLQPIIVMTAVPLGILGAIYTLFLTFGSINSISLLGMIMLTGNAVSISIMLVDRYNFFLEKPENEHHNAGEIITHVTSEHLRPIMMTTLTTIVDLMPLALGLGEGAEATQPMAITVVGGLSFALMLSLFFVPRFYLWIHQMVKKH